MKSMALTLRRVLNTHLLLNLWMYSFLDIRNEKDPFVDAPVHTNDALEYLLEPPKEDYPSIYMNYSKKPEVSKVFDD